jgi:mannitol 2-dehydrogenase
MPKFVLPVVKYQLTVDGPIERATAIVASWARWAEAVDEAGEPIEISDPLAETLTAAARQQRDDPLAFLEIRDIFGDLVDNPRFVEVYRRTLTRLIDNGAKALVDALAAQDPRASAAG